MSTGAASPSAGRKRFALRTTPSRIGTARSRSKITSALIGVPSIPLSLTKVSAQQHAQGDSVLLMPLERARAIVQEAHRLRRPVFVHPSNLAGINIALNRRKNVGVDYVHGLRSTGRAAWPRSSGRSVVI